MPLYEYQEGSRRVVRVLAVADRDNFPGRITVPDRVSVCPRGQPSAEQDGMHGLRKCEEKMGTTAFRQAFPFSVEQTRKAWGKNRATDN